MKRFWAILLTASTLCGCAAGGGQPVAESAAEPLPANYRVMVAEHVRKSFFDPYSMRDVGISQPIPGAAFTGSVSTVCVQANAKNRMGAYTGLKATSFTFRGGQITVADTEYAGITCAAAVYGPFPELEPEAPIKPKSRKG